MSLLWTSLKHRNYDGEEKIVGKGEMLVSSIFSFSHYVFKRPIPQGLENQGLFGKGLYIGSKTNFKNY